MKQGDPITDPAPIPLLDLKALHEPLEAELVDTVSTVAASGRYILGENVKSLEQELATWCDLKHAVAVASGTDALILCLRALDIGPGDEVITTPFSFIATADSISMAGARPVFVDIDPDTFNIDPEQVEAALTPRTRAILPVHLYGQPAPMESLLKISEKHGLAVIEDNAQALGASLAGRQTGSWGNIAATSFFPSKNLGCLGDGGMVFTNDDHLAERVRQLRVHGQYKKYQSTELGMNSRLDELQAAVLRLKLRFLQDWNGKRGQNAARYNDLLKGVDGVRIPVVAPEANHVYHQYTLRLQRRSQVQKALASKRIGSAVYYPEPLHLQPAFVDLGYRETDFPGAETASREVLSLPVGPELHPDQVRQVAQVIIDSTGNS